MEVADVIAVNKADGAMEAVAGRAVASYAGMMHILSRRWREWDPRVGYHTSQRVGRALSRLFFLYNRYGWG